LAHLCTGGEQWADPVPAKVFLKVSSDTIMLFLSFFVYRRRETANPVPDKVFVKVSPDTFLCPCYEFERFNSRQTEQGSAEAFNNISVRSSIISSPMSCPARVLMDMSVMSLL